METKTDQRRSKQILADLEESENLVRASSRIGLGKTHWNASKGCSLFSPGGQFSQIFGDIQDNLNNAHQSTIKKKSKKVNAINAVKPREKNECRSKSKKALTSGSAAGVLKDCRLTCQCLPLYGLIGNCSRRLDCSSLSGGLLE